MAIQVERAVEVIQTFYARKADGKPVGSTQRVFVGENKELGLRVTQEFCEYPEKFVTEAGVEVSTGRITKQPALVLEEVGQKTALVYRGDIEALGEAKVEVVVDLIQRYDPATLSPFIPGG